MNKHKEALDEVVKICIEKLGICTCECQHELSEQILEAISEILLKK